jgi:hypothetical protein
MVSPAAGTRITAMVSPVDGSRPTTPRAWRRDVASCRRPRKASSASNPTLSPNDRRKGRKGRKLNLECTTGVSASRVLPPPIAKSLAEIAEIRRPTHSGFAMRYPPSGGCAHAVAAKLGSGACCACTSPRKAWGGEEGLHHRPGEVGVADQRIVPCVEELIVPPFVAVKVPACGRHQAHQQQPVALGLG